MRYLPRKIDSYIFRELAKSSILGSIVAVLVLLCLQALRLSEFIIKADLDREIIFRMVSGLALSFTPLVLPIACLFSLLGVFGRMATDREFVAAQSMGLAPARLLRPAMVFGAVAVVFAVWTSFSLGPAGNRAFEATVDEALKRRVASALRSGTFTEGFLDMVLFVDRVDPITQDLQRVFLHDASNFKEEISISAKRGRWVQSSDDGVATLKLMDGVVVSRDTARGIVRRIRFDEYRIYSDFSNRAGSPKDSPPSLGWPQLMERRRQSPEENNLRPVWIEIARRFSVSFSCLLFVPLSFALSLDNRRTAKGRAVMTGLVLLFAYWTVYFALMTWILKTKLPFVRLNEGFVWGMIWLPNFALAAWGAWLFRRKRLGMAE